MVVDRSPAGATPNRIVVACPAVTVVVPLGIEKPTAGRCAAPNDGGLASGDDAQVGSGVPESVKRRVPPLVRTEPGR
jgi:hypothetical protein